LEHLTEAEYTDATEMVDAIKVIKSDEEISLIKKTCDQQDEVFEYALTRIQPDVGILRYYGDVFHKCIELGSTQANVMIGSAPHDKAAKHLPKLYANRKLKKATRWPFLLRQMALGTIWGIFQDCLPWENPDRFTRTIRAGKASSAKYCEYDETWCRYKYHLRCS